MAFTSYVGESDQQWLMTSFQDKSGKMAKTAKLNLLAANLLTEASKMWLPYGDSDSDSFFTSYMSHNIKVINDLVPGQIWWDGQTHLISYHMVSQKTEPP